VSKTIGEKIYHNLHVVASKEFEKGEISQYHALAQ